MNVNFKLNTSSTDSLLMESKAVLMEARLQRLSSVVSSGYGNQNAAYNLSSRAENTKPKNISNKRINVHDARSSRAASSCQQASRSSRRHQSTSRSLFSAEPTLDVDHILRELKQVKSNLMKDIECKKGRTNTSLNDTEKHRIQSFMKACDLMLESFHMQPQHDPEECEFERYEKRQTTRRQRSNVRFDLSQNEFYSY